eukprot:jgi/Mesen1/9117/ME000058S08611
MTKKQPVITETLRKRKVEGPGTIKNTRGSKGIINFAKNASAPSLAKRAVQQAEKRPALPSTFDAAIFNNDFDDEDEEDPVEEELKLWDMDMTYGPCLGRTRIQRWLCAEKQGLNPPKNVRTYLESPGTKQQCLWEGRV